MWGCPVSWPSPEVLRAFRDLILTTWTYEEIERVTMICDKAMLPADDQPGEPVMARIPLTVPAGLARLMGRG